MDNNNDNDNDNIDIISTITNPILINIISNLPFKEAARTCIVSKEWLNLWRESTILEFNENFFVRHFENQENQRIQRNVFIDFVRKIVVNYPQKPIKKFSFAFSKPQSFLVDIQNFVLFAASKNVVDLELDFSDPTWREDDLENHPSLFELPLPVYQLNLESLMLFSCRFNASLFTNLSVLKSLSLGWIKINMASLMAFLRNAPLLESLILKKCWDLENFEVTLPNSNIKNLVIDKCNFIQDTFWIDGPRLQSLKYSGNFCYFHLLNQYGMVEADLDFSFETEYCEVGSMLYDFLQELFTVQVLTVCSVFLQIVPQGDEFDVVSPLRVRHLTLKTAIHFNEYHGIKLMLSCCPYLEVLTFDLCNAIILPDYVPPKDHYNPHEFWTRDLRVYTCLDRTLKEVNVKGFRGTVNEIYVLRYLICFGEQLREMNLYLSNDGAENMETCLSNIEYLKRFAMTSPNLRFSVFYN